MWRHATRHLEAVLSHLFSRIRHLPVGAYRDKQSTVKQVNCWIIFINLTLNPLTLDGSPFGAERVPVTLAHAPPLYTRLRQEEGVGVQLLRLQPLPGHLYQDRGLGGIGVQLLRLQPLPGHLYKYRGLGYEVLGYRFSGSSTDG